MDDESAEGEGCPRGDALNGFVDARLRLALEERYWRPIEARCVLEAFAGDDAFVEDPGSHVALYSDHGVVHVRDVAGRAVELAVASEGVLLPARSAERRRFVQGVAVLLAYLHDIGMVDTTPADRRAHPQFAAQTPFTSAFADLLGEIVERDAGGLRSRLEAVAATTGLPASIPETVREVLATSMAHSKTAVPAAALADPDRLRSLLQRAVFTPLPGRDRSPARSTARDEAASFEWVASPHPVHRALAADVLDAVRVVRVADALRQRGTAFRTSAGYEVFLEASTGASIACVRTADEQQTYFLRFWSPISSGEANVRYAEVLASGALRIAFHRGGFPSPAVFDALTRACAQVVCDVAADVLPTFDDRHDTGADTQVVELVTSDGVPEFSHAIADLVIATRPELANRVRVLDHDSEAPRSDRDWTGAGVPLDPHSPLGRRVHGGLTHQGLDARRLEGVRLVRVGAGTTVMHAGTLGRWVLVPVEPGLQVQPLGGYRPSELAPWAPLGVTGVVRGSERNATIVAARDVDVLAVPGEVFVHEWFRPHDPASLRAELQRSVSEP